MENILSIVFTNLKTVGLCLLLLVLFRGADILLGLALSKKNKIKFSTQKLLKGLLLTLYAVTGLACLVTGLSMIIPVITYCGLVTDESIIKTLEVVNVTGICGIILVASVATYGKNAFDKFKEFIGE